jgi:hypothetical protein
MFSLLLALLVPAEASSHREAPGSAKDPTADLTDFYAFVSPEDATKIVFILNVNPLENPGGGPNYHFFDDNVRYQVRIDNEGDAYADIVFTIRFKTTYQQPGTFLYNTGDIGTSGNLNMVQTYTVTRSDDGVETVLAQNVPVAPVNVGEMSDGGPGYDPTSPTPGAITTAYIKTAGSYRFFAGPRQEGFYVDLERTFDLLNLGHADNTNTLLGYNVHSIAIEVPAAKLTRDGKLPNATRKNDVIAAWATTARHTSTVLRLNGTTDASGAFVQVGRLGNPLVNEVVIAVQDKDKFNASKPQNDAANFLSYVTQPLLIQYMHALLGVAIPADVDCSYGLGIGGREDLVEAFLTGVVALGNQPQGYALGGNIPGEVGKKFAAFEALRLNIAGTGAGYWPDGRQVQDDVVDTALSAEAGLLCPGPSGGGTVPDGVDSTGLTYLTTFPFLGEPWVGDSHPTIPSNR